jgi:hypothetical protein
MFFYGEIISREVYMLTLHDIGIKSMINPMFPQVIEMTPNLHEEILLKITPLNGVTKDVDTSTIFQAC